MLGPRPEIAAVFFPKELLDPGWFSQQWFLCVDRTRDEGPTHIAHLLGYDLLTEHWLQLLPLALYDVTGFNVPLVLEAIRGWSLRYIRSGEPMIDADPDGNEIPSSEYSVSAASLSSFRSFLGFMRSADHALRSSDIAKGVARRYLRAAFVTGPFPDVADRDDADDALLLLTFALEHLLLAGEREARADKLALRAAYLVGMNDDTKREEIHLLVKQLYGERSALVHGSKLPRQDKRIPPWRLRGLVRDLVVAFVALRQRVGRDENWAKLMRGVVVSRKDQAFVARVARRPLRLVRPPQ